MVFYQKIDGDSYLKDGEIVPVGEPLTFDQMYGEDFEKFPEGGFGIHRIEWYCKFVEAVGGKKGKVASFLLKNKNSQNVYLGRVQDIAAEVGVAVQTVTDTIKVLREKDIIRTMTCGFMMNPGCEHRGNRRREAFLMKSYKVFGERKFRTLKEAKEAMEGDNDVVRESDD